MKPVLTIIPARVASTRLPRKVLARIAGRTMVEWCYRTARAADIGPVLVATDSAEVCDEVRRFGGEAVMTPASARSGSDRVWLAAKNRKEDVIVNFQGDMPALSPKTLRLTAAALAKGVDIATPVVVLRDAERSRSSSVVKAVVAKDGRCLYFSRAEIPFDRDGNRTRRYEHVGIYVYRRQSLKKFVSLPVSPLEDAEKLEQLRALEAGMTIKAVVVSDRPISVDVPSDLALAEAALCRAKT